MDDRPLPTGRQARSFVSKPRYAQAAVIVAGIACNLIFAWLILSAGYMAGLPTSSDQKTFGAVTDSQVLVVGRHSRLSGRQSRPLDQ